MLFLSVCCPCRLLPNATAALMQSAVLLDRDPQRSAELVSTLILLAEVAMEQDDLRSAYDFVCMALEVTCDDLRLTNFAGVRAVTAVSPEHWAVAGVAARSGV